MRALGFSPSRSRASAEARTSAAAPSVMPGALPAVTVPPSGWKAGFRRASAARAAPGRGVSAVSTGGGPLLPGTRRAPRVPPQVPLEDATPRAVVEGAVDTARVSKPIAGARPREQVRPEVHV